jgi:CRISPR-associated endonuclease/helicase Cas3
MRPTELDVVRGWLKAAGLPCPAIPTTVPHGVIAARVLPNLLTSHLGIDPESARTFATIVAGHHGVFPTAADLGAAAMHSDAIGGEPWDAARARIVDGLARILGVSPGRPFRAPSGATAIALAGLISVADWIGSMQEYFPYVVSLGFDPAQFDFDRYAEQSPERAERALHELRWLDRPAPPALRGFTTTFPTLAPNDLQRAASDIARSLEFPALVVIEAPMGAGKTEAAMYLAEAAAAYLQQPGYYFALPTQATSNQMFTRVREFLERTARHAGVNLQLLHGHASLSAEFELLRKRASEPLPTAVDQDESGGGSSSSVFAAEWFTYRKRGLLAPYGVGTIDQALLAVLKTRHFFVRMFGLAGKTVIIDEVHAYDAYMSTLLERLLEWLAALGSPVILLSATLPSGKRDALLSAYIRGLGISTELPPSEPYPRITWANAQGCGSRAISAGELTRRRLELRTLASNEAFGEELSRLLADGGCVAVICNTVARAQEVFTSLKPFFPGVCEDGEPELILFHARYLFDERDRREKLALARFGKPGAQIDLGGGTRREVMRPRRAVLVATQVIEQSLDLDFDVMVTDFAPVDLILQRAGRIHRHPRTRRAAPVASPALLIFAPRIEQGGAPRFDSGTEAIYHPHLLLRSWLALAGHDSILIPEDVEPLIEFVYRGGAECPAGSADAIRGYWDDTADKLAQELERFESLARENRIPKPGDEDLLERRAELEEDNPEIHESLQALTRISEVPSVDVVMMSSEEFATFNAEELLDRSHALHWLRRSVRIAHRAVARALVNNEAMRPQGWGRSPLLRHHRIVHLDPNGCTSIGKYEVSLDPELGIVIAKES